MFVSAVVFLFLAFVIFVSHKWPQITSNLTNQIPSNKKFEENLILKVALEL